MYPTLPKIELFARQARPGWDARGNEVDKYDARDDVAKSFEVAYVFLIHFALERGYVVENVTGRFAGDNEIAPTPFAQHAAGVFPRHAGHRRQIGVADLLVEHDALRAGRLSDEFRQLERRAGHARLN